MKTFCNFTSDDRECLGSDAWFQLDARNRLDTQIVDCRKRMEQLKRVKPNYNGFRIVRCNDLRGTNERVVYVENKAYTEWLRSVLKEQSC